MAHRGDTAVVHRDDCARIWHPPICGLADGAWLAAFRSRPTA